MTDHSALVKRLREYRPTNEWGDPVHHVIADEAADAICALAAQLSAFKERVVEIEHVSSFDQLFTDKGTTDV